MKRFEAVELILIAKRAAFRVGKSFAVDEEKLGKAGGFSSSEIADINEGVADIEAVFATVKRRLS